MDHKKYLQRVDSSLIYGEAGKVTKSLGLIYEAHLPGASVGSLCEVTGIDGGCVDAEVIGFRDKRILLMPFEEVKGINIDSRVVLKQRISSIRVGYGLLGRVLDARGEPMDGKGPIDWEVGSTEEMSLYQRPIDPVRRRLIQDPLDLGIKAINGLLTVGKGQRMGIMAGSGVGKSVLLGMMARNTAADVNVIGLIGERGREVREFIERDLGEEGLARSVIVVATSDMSPLLRMRGAFLAASISDFFRNEGKDVLLMMDSITRFCMAQREIGLSLGEPPASKGYTPSVFATLPKLLERSGTGIDHGSVTGLYTVLVEGDDMDDPIGDAARSILDGHIVLTRELAQRNHYPAIDVLQSASRVMTQVIGERHQAVSAKIKEWISIYRDAEDLINIGAYVRGTNPKIDQAILASEKITAFLRQRVTERVHFSETIAILEAIDKVVEAHSAHSTPSGAKSANPSQPKTMNFT